MGVWSKQTLAGHLMELSDLAVAYRAVFHAGDNEAFISLDQNKYSTKATVNFGGFENTRLGSVVLELINASRRLQVGLIRTPFAICGTTRVTTCHRFYLGRSAISGVVNNLRVENGSGTRFGIIRTQLESISDLELGICRAYQSTFHGGCRGLGTTLGRQRSSNARMQYAFPRHS